MELSLQQQEQLDRAIAALRSGELVIYPTETFYGIAADPESDAALAKIFAVKGREPDKPIALIAADQDSAFGLAREIPPFARKLADVFWPGPLTLVLPARRGLHPALMGPTGVGVRISPHPIAQALAAGLGRPITATSANLSGDPPVECTDRLNPALGKKAKVILDYGKLRGGAPSTVVELVSVGYRVTRTGAIPATEIDAVVRTIDE